MEDEWRASRGSPRTRTDSVSGIDEAVEVGSATDWATSGSVNSWPAQRGGGKAGPGVTVKRISALRAVATVRQAHSRSTDRRSGARDILTSSAARLNSAAIVERHRRGIDDARTRRTNSKRRAASLHTADWTTRDQIASAHRVNRAHGAAYEMNRHDSHRWQ